MRQTLVSASVATLFSTDGSIVASGPQQPLLYTYEFPFSVDVELQLSSFNNAGGFTERAQVVTVWDEFYPGVGSVLPRQNNVPINTIYSDGNSGPSSAVFRNKTTLSIRVFPNSNLASIVGLRVRYASYGYIQRACRPPKVLPVETVGCPEIDQSAQRMCALGPLPTFFGAFPADWQFSSDTGGSYGPAPGSSPHSAGDPIGKNRWRTAFNVPAGFAGHCRFWVNGDKSDVGDANSFGSFWLDGVQVDANTEVNTVQHWTPYVSVAPGAYTLEWREGAFVGAGSNTPTFGIDYSKVTRDRIPVNRISCNGGPPQDFDGSDSLFFLPVGYTLSAGDCP